MIVDIYTKCGLSYSKEQEKPLIKVGHEYSALALELILQVP